MTNFCLCTRIYTVFYYFAEALELNQRYMFQEANKDSSIGVESSIQGLICESSKEGPPQKMQALSLSTENTGDPAPVQHNHASQLV